MQSKQQGSQYKYLTFYVAAFITCYLTQGVLLNRLIQLWGFYITGGTFIYFLTPLIMDVVTEVYGYKVARQVLWQGLFAVIFFSSCIAILIRTPYPEFWAHTDKAYSIALNSTARSTIIGIFAILIGQFLNVYLISKWKVLYKGKYFWLRSVGSSIIGDTVSTLLAILGIFVGRIPTHAFISLLLPEFIVMIVFSAIGAVPALVLAKMTAKSEGLNVYDKGIDFNPFKLKT
jgi:uncharacterized integral membrane protein (TIGR00697 family)